MWLPINTSPPDDDIGFLVFVPRRAEEYYDCVIQVSRFEGKMYPDAYQNLISWSDRVEDATHWMPLPEPPK